jgi:hypothetical protein
VAQVGDPYINSFIFDCYDYIWRIRFRECISHFREV